MAKEKEKAGKTGRRTNLEAAVEGLSGMEGGAWFKPQQGKNQIRILPAYHTKGPNAGIFFNKKIMHKGIPLDGRSTGLACVKSFDADGECPICNFINALKESESGKDQKMAKVLRPQTVFFVNILNRKTNKLQKYSMSKSIMKIIRGYLVDEDYGDITDPDEGYDVVIEREGEGLSTKYAVKVKPKTSEIGYEDWEEDMFDIFADGECCDKLNEATAYGKMKQAFGKLFTKLIDPPKGFKENDDDDDNDDDEEEEVKETKKSSKKSKEEDKKKDKKQDKKKQKEEEEETEEEVDLDELDRDELKQFIADNDLEIKVKKSMSDDDLREAIEKAMKDVPWEEED